MERTNPFTAASDLAPAYSPNRVVADPDTGDPVLRELFPYCFGGPVPDGLLDVSDSTPLLTWTDPDVPAMSLLDAMLNPPKHRAARCDRCDNKPPRGERVHRLWVPGGQSMVELQMCGLCHDVLNDLHHSLVWR